MALANKIIKAHFKKKYLSAIYQKNHQSYYKLVLTYLSTSDLDWQKFHELIPINMSCG